MFDQATIEAAKQIAANNHLEPAPLLAVAEVESGGRAYAIVDGKSEPLIRFEGHYFDRRLEGKKRTQARKAGLASPTAGKVANPASQAARWRLLEKAAKIDRQAAYESCSWGLGQVMGSHWSWLGFKSVDELVALCRRDVAGQIELMVRYIVKADLAGSLRARNWPRFAEGYNGPGYRKNRYDTKMAEAFVRWAARLGGAAQQATAPTTAGQASSSAAEIQRRLVAHGFPVAIDGRMGPQTKAAIRAFQKARGLAVDGIAGPNTTHELLKTPPSAVTKRTAAGAVGVLVLAVASWASGLACSIPIISNLCGG